MKKVITILLAILFTSTFSLTNIFAQNDTMYIMKSGVIVGQYNVNTEFDSIIFYKPTIEEPTSGTFTDTRDGNVYNWVKIGNQIWMAENLAYLPEVVHSNAEFQTQSSNGQPGYGVYGYGGNDVATAKSQSNYTTYGVLYNWYAVNTIDVCPLGWHIPSDAEWTVLTNSLGGTSVAGSKLKATGTIEAGTGLWHEPNTDATNQANFAAIPAGYRDNDGNFYTIGYRGIWWSATEYTPTFGSDFSDAHFRGVYYNSNETEGHQGVYSKKMGFTVRCVRD